jgi:hypothetical protein
MPQAASLDDKVAIRRAEFEAAQKEYKRLGYNFTGFYVNVHYKEDLILVEWLNSTAYRCVIEGHYKRDFDAHMDEVLYVFICPKEMTEAELDAEVDAFYDHD